jgi:hypothetical protein
MAAQAQILSKRYATASDHYRIFFEEIGSLYWLAFLLTANSDMAERCLAGGLGKCIDRIDVLIEQVPSWARRAVIQEAIRILRPAQQEGKKEFAVNKPSAAAGERNPFAFITSLCTFERFVFVLSILEGLPDLDCQNLLSCSWEDVVATRKFATKLFGAANTEFDCAQEDVPSRAKLLNWPRYS